MWGVVFFTFEIPYSESTQNKINHVINEISTIPLIHIHSVGTYDCYNDRMYEYERTAQNLTFGIA